MRMAAGRRTAELRPESGAMPFLVAGLWHEAVGCVSVCRIHNVDDDQN